MKVLWAYADLSEKEWNTSGHRIYYPSKILQEAGHECKITHTTSLFTSSVVSSPEVREAMDWANVVVIERLLMSDIHATIRFLREKGKKVFCTFDDAYHLMPGSVSRGTWRGGKKALDGRGSILNEFREGLRLCDGALVPSKLLADDYRPYQPNMQYVPNYLYPRLWENLPDNNPNIITIGWGGTSQHDISWSDSGIIAALGILCRKYHNLVVHIQPPYPNVVARMENAGVRYQLADWQVFEEWPKTVAQFHIGVAPLAGNYDSRRSNLKILEYATVGIPWVATDDYPYRECEGGILVRNKIKDWTSALDEVIQKIRVDNNELGERGRKWAQEFNSKCLSRYEEVFNGNN